MTHEITLLYPRDTILPQLARCPIRLIPSAAHSPCNQVDGILLDRQWPLEHLRTLITVDNLKVPRLLLLYGDQVAAGYADHLAESWPMEQAEVVRLCLIAPDRAVLGGEMEGYWLTRLRHHLAVQGVISLLCRRIEADEIARHCRAYLLWKRQFYLRLAQQCEQTGARPDVVARALGMHKSIGQEWLHHEQLPVHEDPAIVGWLAEQCRELGQREAASIETILLCGPATLQDAIAPWFPGLRDFRSYVHQGQENHLHALQESLEGADLLVIADAPLVIRELDFAWLAKTMRQPRVIDCCCCFPAIEMEHFGVACRTFGLSTNLWHKTAYNGE